MASTGEPSLVLVSLLILFLYSSKMAYISSAEPPSNISKTKEKSSDDQVAANKKMVVEEKGTRLPKWHIIRGIKSGVIRSDSSPPTPPPPPPPPPPPRRYWYVKTKGGGLAA
ncbi:hypothetical protein ACOSQ2_009419 [Xanthoceras sorbifolium]